MSAGSPAARPKCLHRATALAVIVVLVTGLVGLGYFVLISFALWLGGVR